jgi:hypothetical protein
MLLKTTIHLQKKEKERMNERKGNLRGFLVITKVLMISIRKSTCDDRNNESEREPCCVLGLEDQRRGHEAMHGGTSGSRKKQESNFPRTFRKECSPVVILI